MVDEEGIEEYSSETIDPQLLFKRNVFYVILDEVIADINKRFESLKTLIDIFSVLWEFKYITESEIKLKSRNLVLKYNDDLQEDLVDELQSLNIVYATNFGHKQLNPLELLNHLHKTNLENMFPNLCIALRIFLTIPATVASAE